METLSDRAEALLLLSIHQHIFIFEKKYQIQFIPHSVSKYEKAAK